MSIQPNDGLTEYELKRLTAAQLAFRAFAAGAEKGTLDQRPELFNKYFADPRVLRGIEEFERIMNPPPSVAFMGGE